MFEAVKTVPSAEKPEKEKRPQRRSSLFINQNLPESYYQRDTFVVQLSNTLYPEGYVAKLHTELSDWENLAKDILHQEEKLNKRLQVDSVKGDVLTEEQENYLSSLPNLHEYVDKATHFLNACTVAEDKISIQIRHKQEIIQRTVQVLRKK